jgi:hypothetical protein
MRSSVDHFRKRLGFVFVLGGTWISYCINAPGADLGLRVSSDFPGGSAKVLDIDQPNNGVRITSAGDPKQGWPCWWYFRLDGSDTNKPVIVKVVAYHGLMPTDTPGERRNLSPDWSLPAQAVYSIDGTNWEHTAEGERQGNYIDYRIKTPSSTLWVAWGPPFTLKDADQLIQKTCDLCPYAKRFVLAHTREGHPVPGLRISEPGMAGSRRFTVWIQARQHAWECGSSWVARGFAEWLVSNDPAAESLRRKADIVVIPIVDVDNVETGQGGKFQTPHDQNRDWDSTPYFPEVRAAMGDLSTLAKADRLDLFLDLHDPGYHNHAIDFYISAVQLMSPLRQTNNDDFLKIAREQMTKPIPFNGKIFQGQTYDPEREVDKCADPWVAANSPSQVLSFTMEIPWNIPGSTPSGYLKNGEQLGRCINLYLTPAIRSGPESGAR